MSISKKERKVQKDKTSGYPPYPPGEDIYNRAKKAENVNPERPVEEQDNRPAKNERNLSADPWKSNTDNGGQQEELGPEDPNGPIGQQGKENPDAANEGRMGGDLDVPGAELDDADEDIGEEDEQNNYYSLGGDKNPEDNRDNSS